MSTARAFTTGTLLIATLCASPVLADESANPGEVITLRGEVAKGGKGHRLRVGQFGVVSTPQAVRGQLRQLAGREVTVLGRFVGANLRHDGKREHFVSEDLRLAMTVAEIVDPSQSELLTGVVKLEGGQAFLATDTGRFHLTRVPTYVLASLRNRLVRVQGWVFSGASETPELAIQAVEARVSSEGYLSGPGMKRKGSIPLPVDTTLMVTDLGIFNTRTKRLKKLKERRQAGDLLFAKATLGKEQGWVPTRKLAFGELQGGDPGLPPPNGGITGVLKPDGKPLPADELDAMVRKLLREGYLEETEERYAELLDDDSLTKEEREELEEFRKYDLDFESVAEISIDEDFDYWEYTDFKDEYGVPRKFLVGYAMTWFGELDGIGLGQYFVFDIRTGAEVAQSDVID